MRDGTRLSSPARGGHRVHNLQAGQAVKVKRGRLAGMTGRVFGFSSDGGCMIALDVVEPGVVLIIEPAAVKKLRKVPSRMDMRTPAVQV